MSFLSFARFRQRYGLFLVVMLVPDDIEHAGGSEHQKAIIRYQVHQVLT